MITQHFSKTYLYQPTFPTPMEKTKLLLVFGKHGYQREKYDEQFSKNAIVPFLEQEIENKKRTAIIITELLEYNNLKSGPRSIDDKKKIMALTGKKAQTKRNLINAELQAIEKKINQKWKETREYGEPFMKRTLNLGFEYKVLEINTKSTGQIENIIEPQTAQTAYNAWKADLLAEKIEEHKFNPEKQIDALADYSEQMIQFQLKRDKDIASLADKLQKQNPERAIIIPRGTAHKGMEVLFDNTIYDIIKHEADYALDFTDELILKSYKSIPTKEEIKEYAKLQNHYVNNYTKNRTSLVQIGWRIFGNEHNAELNLEKNAREYALSMVKELSYYKKD